MDKQEKSPQQTPVAPTAPVSAHSPMQLTSHLKALGMTQAHLDHAHALGMTPNDLARLGGQILLMILQFIAAAKSGGGATGTGTAPPA